MSDEMRLTKITKKKNLAEEILFISSVHMCLYIHM